MGRASQAKYGAELMAGDRLGQEINLSVCSRIFGWIVLTLLLSGCSHDPSSVQVKELRLPPKWLVVVILFVAAKLFFHSLAL